MKKLEAIIRPHLLDEVNSRLRAVGVTGMTMSEVKEFGQRASHMVVYHDVIYSLDFVPKVHIEIVVKDALVAEVAQTLMAAARAGESGDGEILITTLDETVRIGTGELGDDAL